VKSVGTRFLLPFGVLGVLFTIFILYGTYKQSQRYANELVAQQAALATEFNLAIRDYAADKIRPIMEGFVDKEEFIPETMSTSFISRSIFEEVRRKFPNCIIRFSSDNPRNPINMATPDELKVIEYFRKNPQSDRKSEVIQIDGRRYTALFTPKWMKQECMHCHGDPKDAPAALLKRYGTQASFHRKVGDVAGLDTVAIPVELVTATMSSEIRRQSSILVIGLILLFGSVIVMFRLVVTRRLTALAQHFHGIAANPESPQMTPIEVKGNDEISVVGSAFNTLVEQLHTAHASLELRVTQRTAELAQANTALRREIEDRERAEDP
jgi:methyl-accepting chemotaxis protein